MTIVKNRTPWPNFIDLLTAYKACRIGKPSSVHQTKFEVNLGANLLSLSKDLQSRRYKPSRSICFIVLHPKPREIFAAHFRDRIVHHLIVSRLTGVWEPKFSPFSFACRKGRGTHGALRDFQRQVRRVSGGGRKTVYALQLDLASFFVSINRTILLDLLARHTQDEEFLWIMRTSIGHDARKDYIMKTPGLLPMIPPGKSWLGKAPDVGLPIGNLTSQFGANVYLNDLDHWIVRTLKPMGYLRYMDDLTLLHTDKEFLKPLADPVDNWLKTHRNQELNRSKTILKPLTEGIEYLGYHVVQHNNGKSPLRLQVPPIKKWKLIGDIQSLERYGLPPPEDIHPLAIQKSYKSAYDRISTINADSYQFRKATIDRLVYRTAFHDFDLNTEMESTWPNLSSKKNYHSIKVR